MESAELHVVTAAADLGPLLISDGPSGWTTVPYVQIQMQISYIKVGNNKLIQQIVTRVIQMLCYQDPESSKKLHNFMMKGEVCNG